MPHNYYDLPINCNLLMQRNSDLTVCDINKSVAQNIYLIISSKFRENRFDDSYGCELWDLDFELVHNQSLWVERIRKSVLNSIEKHERRIYDIAVEVVVMQEEFRMRKCMGIKKRLTIIVNSKIKETGDPFNFSTNIYLGPLSLS
jgi:phage baseplate assembly protein W